MANPDQKNDMPFDAAFQAKQQMQAITLIMAQIELLNSTVSEYGKAVYALTCALESTYKVIQSLEDRIKRLESGRYN